MITKLFIGGLIPEYDEMDLAQLIAPYGDIVTIKIVRDKMSHKSKGFAFVEVTSKEAGDYAIDALDGKIVNDKELTLNIAQDEVKTPKTYTKVERGTSNVKKKRPRITKT